MKMRLKTEKIRFLLISLLLEKPVCTNADDLKRLLEANIKYSPKVVVSFLLRYAIFGSDGFGKNCATETYSRVLF